MHWGTNWSGTYYIYYIAALIEYSDSIKKFLNKYKGEILIASIVVLILSFSMYISYESSGRFQLICELIASIVMMLIVILSNNFLVCKENILIQFIDKISLEAYLYHGAVIGVMTRLVTNNYAVVFLVVGITFIISYVLNWGWRKIQKLRKY